MRPSRTTDDALAPPVKKLALGLLLVLILAVAAILVVPGLIDWTPYRARIAQEIGALTGRAVTIDGPVSFTMLPTPRLVAGDIRVASVAGAEVPDMLAATEVDLRVSLLPLFLGRVEVQGVAFRQPSIVLETLPDGRRSWDGFGDGIGRRLDAVRATVEQGAVLWLDRRDGHQIAIESADARLSAGPTGVAVTGTGVLAGVPMTLDLSAQPRSQLGTLPVTVTLGLDQTEARLGGLLRADGSLQGDLSVVGKDLDASLARIGIRLPASSTRPGVFALRGTLQAGADRIELAQLSADLGEARAAGGVAVTLGAVPNVEMTLGVSRLTLADWTGGADPATLGARLMQALAGRIRTPVTGTIDLSVAALAVRGGLARDVRLQATLDPARLTVNRLAFGLPGAGSVAIAGGVKLDGDRPAADQLTVQAGSDDLRGLLGWVGVDAQAVPATVLRRGKVAATLSGQLGDLRVNGLDVDLDGNRLTGALTYVGGDRPGIGARLTATRLDIDAYRPADAPRLADLLQADADLRGRVLAWLGAADANLDLTVDAAAVDGVAYDGLRLEATMAQGALTIHRGRVGGPGGAELTLAGAVGKLSALGDLDLQADLKAADPAALLRALRLDGRVPVPPAGPVAASLRLRGDAASLSVDGSAQALGGTVMLGGTVTDLVATPRVALSLRVTHPDLASVLRPLGEGRLLPPDFGAVDLYADADWGSGRLILDNLQGVLGPVSLAGRLDLTMAPGRPRLVASLRTTALPLDRLLAGGNTGAEAVGQWPARPFNLSGLAAIDGSLDLTAASISFGDWTVDQPVVRARLDQGVLVVDQLAAGVAGGRLGATGQVELGAVPRWTIDANLVGADVATLLRQTTGLGGVAGRLDLGLKAAASGDSIAAIVYSLTGKGLLAISDARLDDLDLAAVDRLLADPGLPGAFLEQLRAAFASGSTMIPATNATFTIADGLATATDLRLATDTAVGAGGFTLDLPRWRLDLGVDLTFHTRPDVPAVGLRFEGTPSAPVRRLETRALQDWVAARASARPAPEAAPDPAPAPGPVPDPAPTPNP